MINDIFLLRLVRFACKTQVEFFTLFLPQHTNTKLNAIVTVLEVHSTLCVTCMFFYFSFFKSLL
jgi:hypothetical protein